MSKPFVVKVLVEDRIAVQTSDGSASLVLDQNAATFWATLQTDLFSKGILLTNDPNATLDIQGGNIGLRCTNGNMNLHGSQILTAGDGNWTQNMSTVDSSVTLNPANALYNEFNNTSIGGLNVISRVDIYPPIGGTIINSIIVNAGNPNPDGRHLWWQNLGLGTLTFTNLSGAGTAGGLIRAPAATYVVPIGGGVEMMFDDTIAPDGLWLIRGI